MNFSLLQILLLVIVYLSALFAVALAADRGLIAKKITDHPAVYVLSLGVFAGAMASNGVMDLAYRYGYNFLFYYTGVVLMFVLAALLLMPLLRLCRIYQLSSLADVLAFRFRSPRVGAAITVAMCITLLPLLALQIQAVGDSVHILAGGADNLGEGEDRHNGLALLFCLIITVFSLLFGTRNVSAQQRNTGLVVAMAFESLVKLLALTGLLLVAVYQVFGGFAEIQQWLQQSPRASQLMTQQMRGDTARALLLVFFAGAVCMPHIFHMAFTENTESRDLRTATWGLPAYLLLLSLPVVPVTLAGIKLGHSLPMEYSGLAIGQALQSKAVSATAFIASLSAASATIVVTTLALANMCLNHLILPSRKMRIEREQNIYSQLQWARRGLTFLLILAGYGFYITLDNSQSLTDLALVAFSGTLQFLPGIIAVHYWPSANRIGLMSGLGVGLALWFLTLLLPTLTGYQPSIVELYSFLFDSMDNKWSGTTLLALGGNCALFIFMSLLGKTSAEEQVAAEICSMDDLSRPTRQVLLLQSAAEFSERLTPALGERAAQAEVQRALQELQFSVEEDRPYALRRLRRRIEANLSGLMGPAVAHNIIERCIPLQAGGTEDINQIERNLDLNQHQFTGLAADLDNLRRHYRETLDRLPVGIYSLGADAEILMWNRATEQITGVPADQVLGSRLSALPLPWRELMEGFHQGGEDTILKTEVVSPDSGSRWISLHRTAAGESGENSDSITLVEDITDFERLEEELLHSERLASIGRLAAGVAHEIGNPVTGIACLAQNLEYAVDPQEIEHTAQDILRQTQRVTRIVESLMNFSHIGNIAGDTHLAPANLADCVDEAIHLLSLDREARPVQFSNHCDRELVVLADSQRMLQVFVNLLGNARDACDELGHVQIQAHRDGEQVLIDVDDNGCGIPVELHKQIFEPFFTTKDPGEGTGLGLALIFSIMEGMGGSVQLTSPLEQGERPGSRFTLQLARASYGKEFEV